MATTPGLGSAISLCKESTWGTASAGTYRLLPFISESLSLDKGFISSKTLKGGTVLPVTASWRTGNTNVAGDTGFELLDRGMGTLWEGMLGGASVGAPSGGNTPITYTPAAALPSFTVDVGFGGTSSVVRKRYTGAKIDNWELACVQDELATLGLSWVAEDETLATGQTLSGSYPTSYRPFAGVDIAVSLNSVSPTCVKSVTFKGANNLAADERCLGTASIKEPVRNGFGSITGTVQVTFQDLTEYNLFVAATAIPLVVTLTSVAGGSVTTTITTSIRLDGSTPKVSGPERILQDLPFTCTSTTDALAFTCVVNCPDTAP